MNKNNEKYRDINIGRFIKNDPEKMRKAYGFSPYNDINIGRFLKNPPNPNKNKKFFNLFTKIKSYVS